MLSIDADEIVPPELADEINNIFSYETNLYSGYYIPRLAYFLGKPIKHCGWYPGYVLRLFNKNNGRWKNQSVHESVEIVSGKTAKLRNHLLHYTYNSVSEYIERQDKYSTLWAQENFSKINSNSIIAVTRMIFSFIKMYFLRLGFLDGKHGFILCRLASRYVYSKYIKVWKLNK